MFYFNMEETPLAFPKATIDYYVLSESGSKVYSPEFANLDNALSVGLTTTKYKFFFYPYMLEERDLGEYRVGVDITYPNSETVQTCDFSLSVVEVA